MLSKNAVICITCSKSVNELDFKPCIIFWKPMTKQKLLFKMHMQERPHVSNEYYIIKPASSTTPRYSFFRNVRKKLTEEAINSVLMFKLDLKYKPTVRTGPYFGSSVMKLPNFPLKLLFYLKVRNISASPVWLHSGLYFIGQKGSCTTTTTYLSLMCL